MPIRVASHLYRNRHGTFYFRYILPKCLRSVAGASEVRFSMQTEHRQGAIIDALPFIADLPHLTACLRRMADTNESAPPDYFKLWRLKIIENASLSTKITILKEELEEQQYQIAGMVPRAGARSVVKHAYTIGQLKGKKELEEHLVFPWPTERTSTFSELLKYEGLPTFR